MLGTLLFTSRLSPSIFLVSTLLRKAIGGREFVEGIVSSRSVVALVDLGDFVLGQRRGLR